MSKKPLRYSIDCWEKLTDCLSNLSAHYTISVKQILDGAVLTGKIISIDHDIYGTLESFLIHAEGIIVDSNVPDISDSQILEQLAKFGFLIEFSNKPKLSISQLFTLRGIFDIGFSYVRDVIVQEQSDSGSSIDHGYVIAFRAEKSCDDLLNNWYSPKATEFQKLCNDGSIFILHDTRNVNGENWSWINSIVYRISDLLSRYSSELYSIDRRNLSENLNKHINSDTELS